MSELDSLSYYLGIEVK
jgi:hypothetical protein